MKISKMANYIIKYVIYIDDILMIKDKFIYVYTHK